MSFDPDPTINPAASLFEVSNQANLGLKQTVLDGIGGLHPSTERDTTATLAELRRQVQMLSRQLAEERQANLRLQTLSEFGKRLENAPNATEAAASMATLLAQMMHCALVCIFESNSQQQFKLLASAGHASSLLPANYQPDLSQRAVSLAIHKRRLVSSRDLPEDGSPLVLGEERFRSLIAVPLVSKHTLRGLVLLADPEEQTFHFADFPVLESAAAQLLTAWDYARHNETLTDLIQSVSLMSLTPEAGKLLEMTAGIAQQTLGARYVLAAALYQDEWLIRDSGGALRVIPSLKNEARGFLEEAMRSPYTFRLNDFRKDERTAPIQIDSSELCSLMACPIRISGSATGVLLAFGKLGADRFSDSDVFLAELLVSQAAINLESCLLNHELRASLKKTQLLYDLSLSIGKAGSLKDAARAISLTAYRLLQALSCGLILFAGDGRTEAEVRFPAEDATITHPYGLIQQAMDSRQTIYLAESENTSRIAIPIQTMRRCYGALWLEISEDNDESRHPTEEIRILVNQAAVALERSILLEETRRQASEISRSYTLLETAYEDLLYGLTRALDARDGETEKHSWRVEDLSVRIGIEMGLPRSDLKALKRGALLHDIGKIGIRDDILRKPGPLTDQEWEEMHKHPQKGAQIIQEIPALHDALPVIAYHQERWDGSGYPMKWRGTEIPLIARIFAVVDVFDALTSSRPYRTKAMTVEEALAYIETQAGIQFDPDIVHRFVRLVRSESGPATVPISEHR